MAAKKYWPKVEKRWAQDGLILGWSPNKGPVEMERVTVGDSIVLHNSFFSAEGRTGDQKQAYFERSRGDFSFTPDGVDQYCRTEASGELLYIIFDPQYRKQFVDELSPSLSFDEPLDKGHSLNRYDELANLVIDFLVSDGFGGKLRGEALASLVMSEVISQFDKTANAYEKYHLAPHLLNEVRDYIDAHCDDHISVESLADIAGVSKFHFTRMFKLETGHAPYQYVLRHRIKKAQNLLVGTNKSIAEIALDTGFSSQSRMNDAFTRMIGVTPGHYRRSVRS